MIINYIRVEQKNNSNYVKIFVNFVNQKHLL